MVLGDFCLITDAFRHNCAVRFVPQVKQPIETNRLSKKKCFGLKFAGKILTSPSQGGGLFVELLHSGSRPDVAAGLPGSRGEASPAG